jgi:hypothetical protein
MVHAFTGITLFEFRQVQAGAEMVAFAVHHGGASLGGQVLEDIAQRLNQAVAQGIALGRAAEPDHGNGALHLQRNTLLSGTFKGRVEGSRGGHGRHRATPIGYD